MSKLTGRPFDVTKAVDLSDAQIAETWVDLPDGGFRELVDPLSPMPTMLLGGKGSGRTHLMRYYSYAVQKIRAIARKATTLGVLRDDGYVGVYMRCEGLNSGRFDGKGQSKDAWAALFAYYFDLWLGEVALLTLCDVTLHDSNTDEASLVSGVLGLFDTPVTESVRTFEELIRLFRAYRQEIDVAVNNVAITRTLSGFTIRSSPGRIVFGIPALFAGKNTQLHGIQVLYLIDELENLTEAQQRYLNTLIREKQFPSTFMIGSRLYGFRTTETLSAGESNRAGAEYQVVMLDDFLRVNPAYDRFARNVVIKRLQSSGYSVPQGADKQRRYLRDLFKNYGRSRFSQDETEFIVEKYKDEERPYFTKLRKDLEDALRRGRAPGVGNAADIDEVTAALRCDSYPLLEKANIFLLYRAWSIGRDLLLAAEKIKIDCALTLQGPMSRSHRNVLQYFKSDLLAQLLRDCRQKQRYLGLETFIDMSSGLPRNLLITLKHIHKWAVFYGELPFNGEAVSVRAQQEGVREASNWFLEDSRAVGSNAEFVHGAVLRLAEFLKRLRFSDKPAECSLNTFTFNESAISKEARDAINAAHDVSLLLRVIGGHKEGKDKGVVPKYQLNPMLCPRYDLPIARRGAVHLSSDEVEAIFGAQRDEFESIIAVRLSRMNAPFERKTSITRRARVVTGSPES